MTQPASVSLHQDLDLLAFQRELSGQLNGPEADLREVVEQIAVRMLSARNECLVILGVFGADHDRLESFLRAAEPMGALKPATIPSLLKKMGKLDKDAFAQRNIIDVLEQAA